MVPEDQEQGNIEGKVVKQFIKYCGGPIKFVAVLLFAILCSMITKTLGSIMIQIWCQNPSESNY
jgi:hypothetical protein